MLAAQTGDQAAFIGYPRSSSRSFACITVNLMKMGCRRNPLLNCVDFRGVVWQLSYIPVHAYVWGDMFAGFSQLALGLKSCTWYDAITGLVGAL